MKSRNCKLLIFSYLEKEEIIKRISLLSKSDRQNLRRIRDFTDFSIKLPLYSVPIVLKCLADEQIKRHQENQNELLNIDDEGGIEKENDNKAQLQDQSSYFEYILSLTHQLCLTFYNHKLNESYQEQFLLRILQTEEYFNSQKFLESSFNSAANQIC